jgi:hypothetical protein
MPKSEKPKKIKKSLQQKKEEADKLFLANLKKKRFIPSYCQRVSRQYGKHRHVSKNTVTRNRISNNKYMFLNCNYYTRKKEVKI